MQAGTRSTRSILNGVSHRMKGLELRPAGSIGVSVFRMILGSMDDLSPHWFEPVFERKYQGKT
jgi:hypothetical protein